VSPILDALVLIGNSLLLLVRLSSSYGDEKPLYEPPLSGVIFVDYVPKPNKKLLFKGRNL
jgi:hypothetical protein